MEFTMDVFQQFDKKWALLTAGTAEDFNMMTISWGGLGTIWGKPVATTYVRTSRYTHEYMDKNAYFTISFFPEEYRKVLGVLGAKSGRNMDKMHDSGLKAKKVAVDDASGAETVTFEEAELTLVCRSSTCREWIPKTFSTKARRPFTKTRSPMTSISARSLRSCGNKSCNPW